MSKISACFHILRVHAHVSTIAIIPLKGYLTRVLSLFSGGTFHWVTVKNSCFFGGDHWFRWFFYKSCIPVLYYRFLLFVLPSLCCCSSGLVCLTVLVRCRILSQCFLNLKFLSLITSSFLTCVYMEFVLCCWGWSATSLLYNRDYSPLQRGIKRGFLTVFLG